MDDPKRKLKNIKSMRSFSKAAFIMTAIGSLLCVWMAGVSNVNSIPYALTMGLAATLFMALMASAICLLADIASELVIRRLPKDKAS